MTRLLSRCLARLRRLWRDYSLAECYICRRILFSKDVRIKYTTTGATAVLCEKCHGELFSPWSKETRR